MIALFGPVFGTLFAAPWIGLAAINTALGLLPLGVFFAAIAAA
jgi:hypothetical protein